MRRWRSRRSTPASGARRMSPGSSRSCASLVEDHRSLVRAERELQDALALSSEASGAADMRELAAAEVPGLEAPGGGAARGRAPRDDPARGLGFAQHGHGDPGRDRGRGGRALRRGARPQLPEVRRLARLEGPADEQQPLGEGRSPGDRFPHRRNRRLQAAQVGERRPPGPARAGDRGERADPHLDRHGRGPPGGGGGRHPDRTRRTWRSPSPARAGRAGRA